MLLKLPAAKKDAPTAAELSAIIESKIMDYGGKVELEEIGKVLAIGDGIARYVAKAHFALL